MDYNKARFYQIIYRNTFDEHLRSGIGTYKEKKLHIILKKFFEEDPQYHEIPVNGFIADICRERVITEIETSGFSGLGPKLEAYLPEYTVRLVYPMAAKKFVSWIDPETSEISARHLSPKKANAYDALFELVRILPYVGNPNLTVLAPMLEMDEYRFLDGWSRNKKRGSTRYERIPTDLWDILEFRTDSDYARYIPAACRESFTVKDFADEAGIDDGTARAVMKVFETRGLLERNGKNGRSFLYSRTERAHFLGDPS